MSILKIDCLPISEEIKRIIKNNGFSSLYPPQIESMKVGVLEGKNLVLASPTASGKTLVAELCILKKIIEKGGTAVYLTPLKALASEKYFDLKKYAGLKGIEGKIKIAISTGDYDSSDEWLGKYNIIVCTNEKVDSLLRHEARWIQNLKVIVVDEAHLLIDPERGPTLEIALTKLKILNPKAQILLLSATIQNAEEIAEWIDASHVTMDWRPVPLKEGVYYDCKIDFKDNSSKRIDEKYVDPILDISMDAICKGGQVLVFTETRKSAVVNGKKFATTIASILPKREKLALSIISKQILSSGEKTKLSEELASQIKRGASFHHAGLPIQHRRIIEKSFKEGKIKILAATPTLALGVNLPARLVLISSYERYVPGYGRYPISVLEYKQFSGRAGRPKYDDIGESILIAKSDREKNDLFENYVNANSEKIESKLAIEKVLRPHVLSLVASKFIDSIEELFNFFSKTFYAHQYDSNIIRPKIEKILRFLCEEDMIEIFENFIDATKFGQRVSELYIDPLSAVIIRNALFDRARKLTDLSFLHLISHTPDVTPKLYTRIKEEKELNIFAESHIDEFMIELPDQIIEFENYHFSYSEFLSELKSTCVLIDWINERSEDEILKKHNVEPGDLLRLVQTSEWLLYAMHELAKLYRQQNLLKKLSELRIRVKNGIKSELLSLIQLEGVGRMRARSLFNSGYKNINELKNAKISSLATIPLIGIATARNIKEQIGGAIDESELKMIKEENVSSENEQRLITEYKE
ncbi:MAG: DEAD/DEAH box helicase [Candidatus Bathyarchaeota archaeon]|nr:DEAD/DEAH box helicase [Candidatus Bathyarchaeota archaeon]